MLYIFIGTDSAGGCAECNMVLEYSIKKHISGPYEIVRMMHTEDQNSVWGGWYTKNWSTPFSGYRYGISEYMRRNNLEGFSLYCDDDQLFLTDPYEITKIQIPPGKIMTGKQLSAAYGSEMRHCVSLIDHEQYNAAAVFKPSDMIAVAPQNTRMLAKTHPDYVNYCKASTFPLTHVIGDEWNCYDGEDMDIKDIKLLHFTDMSTNPGVKLAIERLGSQARHWYDGPIREHRRKDIEEVFHDYYREAQGAGFVLDEFLPVHSLHVQKGSQHGYKANNGWG